MRGEGSPDDRAPRGVVRHRASNRQGERYVFVVGDDHVAHQRLIAIEHELDDIFTIAKGLGVNDKIVFEGVRQVRDGDKVECEFRAPEQVLGHLKDRAE